MRPPCVFCEDGVEKQGKLLKCLHKVCNDCLPASVQKDGKIRCAKCRRPTPCPPPARSHEQLLVDDSMFDSVPNEGIGTKKVDEKDKDLQIVLDENLNTFSVRQESARADFVRLTMVRADGIHEQIPPRRRAHLCPYHTKMAIRYYCTHCREAMCEKCKVDIKHAAHVDQISHVHEAATAIRNRLTERLRNLVPDDKEEEVNVSMHHAGNLLGACEYDLARRVSSIKTQISDTVKEQLLKVEKRKEELMSEGEFRKMELDERQDYFRKSDKVAGALQHIRAELTRALRHEDLVKMHPNLNKRLTESLRNVDDNRRSPPRRPIFSCKTLTELQGHFGASGKVVDNTGIDLGRCAFGNGSYRQLAGKELHITALIGDTRGQPLSKRALKNTSIQIWATRIGGDFCLKAAVQVPIVELCEGKILALFKNACSEPAGIILELLLDIPCPFPKFKSLPLCRYIHMCCPLKVWYHVYKSRAVFFRRPSHCTSKGCIEAGHIVSHLSEPFAGSYFRQVKSGVATMRGLEPIQDTDFGVAFLIIKCPSNELDIGFTWDCTENSQEMKLVLASSNNSNSPICNFASEDVIHVTRCPHTLVKYKIDHYSEIGRLKNKYKVTLDSNTKPKLMLRMFCCDTQVLVIEYDKKQLKQRFQDLIKMRERY